LWDPRVRRSPLFTLRFHKSPISDILVGSRTDPLMVSAAADGTLATWDFRTLSGSDSSTQLLVASNSENQLKKRANAVRSPSSTMAMHQRKGVHHTGTVLLSRGPGRDRRTVLSIGADAIIREWDISSGKSIRHDSSKHVDVVSSFQSFGDAMQSSGVDPSDATAIISGTITSSWDGTIRMRKLVDKSSS
jgi:WD40 repeat protein